MHIPRAVLAALDLRDRVVQVELRTSSDEPIEKLSGHRAVIDVGSGSDPGRRNRFALLTVVNEQRRPLGNHGWIFGVLNAGKQWLIFEKFVAAAQVINVGFAVHEGHVWRRIDECRRRLEHTFFDKSCPPLPAQLKLLIDVDRFVGRDRAVCRFGHVVQLAERRVPGARVVPWVRAFFGDATQAFEDFDAPVGLNLAEQGAERGAHYSATDENNINALRSSHSALFYRAKSTALTGVSGPSDRLDPSHTMENDTDHAAQ